MSIHAINYVDKGRSTVKSEIAAGIYSQDGKSFDLALPQTWVDEMFNRGFDNVTGHFVWVYDKEDAYTGYPGPLTEQGVIMLAKIARWIR